MTEPNNQQPAEKVLTTEDGHLDVHSIFATIQGEGPFAGRPAVFIRLAGCNLQCPQCDTEYTDRRRLMSVTQIIEEVEACDKVAQHFDAYPPLTVITGGEPFRQYITPLTKALLACGEEVQVETNGTLYQAGFPYAEVTVVCSPKTPSINSKLLGKIDAFKYVGGAGNISPIDGLPFSALGNIGSPEEMQTKPIARPDKHGGAEIYLQPIDEGHLKINLENQKAVIESCLKHGHRLCLQMHKICNLE